MPKNLVINGEEKKKVGRNYKTEDEKIKDEIKRYETYKEWPLKLCSHSCKFITFDNINQCNNSYK